MGPVVYLKLKTLEDDFPFPQVGYVSSLEGTCFFGPKNWAPTSWFEKHTKTSDLLGLTCAQNLAFFVSNDIEIRYKCY